MTAKTKIINLDENSLVIKEYNYVDCDCQNYPSQCNNGYTIRTYTKVDFP